MATYTYSNGNYSSTTSVVNGVSYTQNVTMLGGTGNGCGDSACSQGYSLYFPCLKTINRGEDVCFEFYVVDNSTQDVVDLDTVGALTISLTGRYGCSLGDFSYANKDIEFIQDESFKEVVNEGFTERAIYTLNVLSVDTDGNTIATENISGFVGSFYCGKKSVLTAGDTATRIFLGWIDIDDYDEDCSSGYMSTENTITVTMNSDRNIAAVYRDRNVYKFVNNSSSISSFSCLYNGTEKDIDERNEFMEGYSVVVKAVPKAGYIFDRWHLPDTYYGTIPIIREIVFNDSDIDLGIYANRIGSVNAGSLDDNYFGYSIKSLIKTYWDNAYTPTEFAIVTPTENELDPTLEEHSEIDIDTLFDEDTNVLGYSNLTCYYAGENCIIKMGNESDDGYIKISNPGLSESTIVEIYCMSNGKDCSLRVSLDDDYITQDIGKYEGDVKLLYTFDKTDFNIMTIETIGETTLDQYESSYCMIDKIVISDKVITDKGKAKLCIGGNVTTKFHVGQITATGAISINNSVYSLPCTQIGNVSSIPTLVVN